MKSPATETHREEVWRSYGEKSTKNTRRGARFSGNDDRKSRLPDFPESARATFGADTQNKASKPNSPASCAGHHACEGLDLAAGSCRSQFRFACDIESASELGCAPCHSEGFHRPSCAGPDTGGISHF